MGPLGKDATSLSTSDSSRHILSIHELIVMSLATHLSIPLPPKNLLLPEKFSTISSAWFPKVLWWNLAPKLLTRVLEFQAPYNRSSRPMVIQWPPSILNLTHRPAVFLWLTSRRKPGGPAAHLRSGRSAVTFTAANAWLRSSFKGWWAKFNGGCSGGIDNNIVELWLPRPCANYSEWSRTSMCLEA